MTDWTSSHDESDRNAFATIVAGGAMTLTYAALAARSRAPEGATLGELGWATLAFLIVMASLVAWSRRSGRQPATRWILGFAVVYHAIGVLGSPILEDDPARYRLDGWVFAERGSPYGLAPEALFEVDVPADVEALLDDVNHPAIPTIYGPTLQWIYRGAHALAGTALWPIQVAMALGSLMLLWLIAPRASPLALAFLAWHPLLIKEFAFTAHPDAFAVALVVAAELVRRRSPWAAGALLGLGIGAKLFAVLTVPWIVRRSPRAALATLATLAALYGPFLTTILAPTEAPSPHLSMGLAWVFNAPAHLALAPFIGSTGARLVLGLAAATYLGFLAFLVWRAPATGEIESDLPGQRVFGVMLLALPVLNPWYVIWPLAWWARAPTAWLATTSLVVLASYVHGLNVEGDAFEAYVIPAPIIAFEAFAILAAACWDVRRRAENR